MGNIPATAVATGMLAAVAGMFLSNDLLNHGTQHESKTNKCESMHASRQTSETIIIHAIYIRLCHMQAISVDPVWY